MRSVPDLAPGCFGSALTFDSSDDICRSCPFSEKCEPVHQESLAALRKHFGIVPRKRREIIRSNVADRNQEFQDRIGAFVRNIAAGGYNVIENLRTGRNPFGPEKFKFLGIACHLLLHREHVSEEMISACCVYKLECPKVAGDSYARMSIHILSQLGAIEVFEGETRTIKIRR